MKTLKHKSGELRQAQRIKQLPLMGTIKKKHLIIQVH